MQIAVPNFLRTFVDKYRSKRGGAQGMLEAKQKGYPDRLHNPLSRYPSPTTSENNSIGERKVSSSWIDSINVNPLIGKGTGTGAIDIRLKNGKVYTTEPVLDPNRKAELLATAPSVGQAVNRFWRAYRNK